MRQTREKKRVFFGFLVIAAGSSVSSLPCTVIGHWVEERKTLAFVFNGDSNNGVTK